MTVKGVIRENGLKGLIKNKIYLWTNTLAIRILKELHGNVNRNSCLGQGILRVLCKATIQ
jgi:hypothetical protein